MAFFWVQTTKKTLSYLFTSISNFYFVEANVTVKKLISFNFFESTMFYLFNFTLHNKHAFFG